MTVPFSLTGMPLLISPFLFTTILFPFPRVKKKTLISYAVLSLSLFLTANIYIEMKLP